MDEIDDKTRDYFMRRTVQWYGNYCLVSILVKKEKMLYILRPDKYELYHIIMKKKLLNSLRLTNNSVSSKIPKKL